jgi:hypothetical protein
MPDQPNTPNITPNKPNTAFVRPGAPGRNFAGLFRTYCITTTDYSISRLRRWFWVLCTVMDRSGFNTAFEVGRRPQAPDSSSARAHQRIKRDTRKGPAINFGKRCHGASVGRWGGAVVRVGRRASVGLFHAQYDGGAGRGGDGAEAVTARRLWVGTGTGSESNT